MEDKIVAHNLIDLRQKIIGRINCEIYVTPNLYKEIKEMPNEEYTYFFADIKRRNIRIILKYWS